MDNRLAREVVGNLNVEICELNKKITSLKAENAEVLLKYDNLECLAVMLEKQIVELRENK